MLLQGAAAITLGVLFAFATNAQAYNDDSPMYKWSPRFLYGRATGPVYTTSGTPQRASRYVSMYGLPSMGASGYDFEGSLASRNPGFYSGSYQMKRSACVGIGEQCVIRSGLMGTMMKLSCCPGSTCTLMGHSFNCVANQDDYDESNDTEYNASGKEGADYVKK